MTLKRLSHLGLAVLFQLSAGAATAAAVGETAPEIVGKTLSGVRFKLSSQRGQPTVLNFFWVNCVPCRAEMPELAELEKNHPNVKFLSVHVEDDPDEAVAEFVGKLTAAPRTVVLASRRVQTNYKTLGLPETHLLDKNGKVIATLNGYSEHTLGMLKEWLGKQQ